MAHRSVCVLTPKDARRFEELHAELSCECHPHVSPEDAFRLVSNEQELPLRVAGLVIAQQGRWIGELSARPMRLALLPRILGWAQRGRRTMPGGPVIAGVMLPLFENVR